MGLKINKDRVKQTARVYFRREEGFLSMITCIKLALIDERKILERENYEKEAARRRAYSKAKKDSIFHDMSLLADSLTAFYANNTYNGD